MPVCEYVTSLTVIVSHSWLEHCLFGMPSSPLGVYPLEYWNTELSIGWEGIPFCQTSGQPPYGDNTECSALRKYCYCLSMSSCQLSTVPNHIHMSRPINGFGVYNGMSSPPTWSSVFQGDILPRECLLLGIPNNQPVVASRE